MTVGKRTEVLPPTVWGNGVERDRNRRPWTRAERRAMRHGTFDWSKVRDAEIYVRKSR